MFYIYRKNRKVVENPVASHTYLPISSCCKIICYLYQIHCYCILLSCSPPNYLIPGNFHMISDLAIDIFNVWETISFTYCKSNKLEMCQNRIMNKKNKPTVGCPTMQYSAKTKEIEDLLFLWWSFWSRIYRISKWNIKKIYLGRIN